MDRPPSPSSPTPSQHESKSVRNWDELRKTRRAPTQCDKFKSFVSRVWNKFAPLVCAGPKPICPQCCVSNATCFLGVEEDLKPLNNRGRSLLVAFVILLGFIFTWDLLLYREEYFKYFTSYEQQAAAEAAYISGTNSEDYLAALEDYDDDEWKECGESLNYTQTISINAWKKSFACSLGYGPDADVWDSLCTEGQTEKIINGETDKKNCARGTVNVQGCAAGFYQGDDVQAKGTPCPVGFFCPEDWACAIMCPFGSLCLNSTLAANGNKCSFPNIGTLSSKKPTKMYDVSQSVCNGTLGNSDGSDTQYNVTKECPGSYAVKPCPAGYYCESPVTYKKCPKKHYCPAGSWEPIECQLPSFCLSEGQSRPQGVQTMVAGIVALLFVGWFLNMTILKVRGHLRKRREIQLANQLKELEEYQKEIEQQMAAELAMADDAKGELSLSDDEAEGSMSGGAGPRRDSQNPLHNGAAAHGGEGAAGTRAASLEKNGTGGGRMTSVEGTNGAAAGEEKKKGFRQSLEVRRMESLNTDVDPAMSFCGCEYYTHRIVCIVFPLLGVGTVVTCESTDQPTAGAYIMLYLSGISLMVLGIISCVSLMFLQVPKVDTAQRRAQDDRIEGDMELGRSDSIASDFSSISHIGKSSKRNYFDDGVVLKSLIGPTKSRTRIDFNFEKLGLRLNSTGQQVLAGVTGHCVAGTVTAVMGPSGAGKTTFINTLAGKATYGQTTGTVLINGVVQNIKRFSNVIGFVPQEDIMHRELTVKEILTAYAMLRQPAGTKPEEVMNVVRDVIQVLQLHHVRHSVVGDEATRGISGGQRKRVNVGMEMVADPSVLFLDEPTSGLDSTTSYDLVTALKELANRGTNVITVLHQPSFPLYKLFTTVLLLGKGGRTVFLGRSEDALDYFQDSLGFTMPPLINPADFFMDCIAGKYECEVAEHMQRTSALQKASKKPGSYKPGDNPMRAIGPPRSKQNMAPLTPENFFDIWETYGASFTERDLAGHTAPIRVTSAVLRSKVPRGFFRATGLFMTRQAIQHFHSANLIMTDCLLVLVTGMVLGRLYNDVELGNLAATSLVYALGLGMTIGLSSLRVFGSERVVYWRECASGSGMNLNPLAYFIGKNLVDLPRIMLLVLLLSMAFYPQANPLTDFGTFYEISVGAAFAVSGWSYFLSITFDGKAAQLYIVVALLIFFMTAGVTPKLTTLVGKPTYGVSYLSYARWLCEDFFVGHTYELTAVYRLPPTFYENKGRDSLFTHLIVTSYSEAFKIYGFPPVNLFMNIWIGLFSRSLSLFSLVAANREKRGLMSYTSMFTVHVINRVHDWASMFGTHDDMEQRKDQVHRQASQRISISASTAPPGFAVENNMTSGGDDFTPPPSSPSLHTGLSSDVMMDVKLDDDEPKMVGEQLMPPAEDSIGKRSSEVNHIR